MLAPGHYNTFNIEYTTVNPVSHVSRTLTLTVNHTNIDFHEGKNKKIAPDVTDAVLPIRYLFHDGTTGMLSEAGMRKPIGLVITEKTATTDGMAIALKDAARDVPEYPLTPVYAAPEWDALVDNGSPNFQSNIQVFANFSDALTDMKGHDWTWNPTYSVFGVGQKVGKKFKRTPTSSEIYRYPAFHYAGNFGDEIAAQGITVTGTLLGRKWYLPSMGEWYKFVMAFYMPGSIQSQWSINSFTMYLSIVNDAFIAAGGTNLGDGGVAGYYWTSTEFDNNNAASATITSDGIMFENDMYKGYPQGNIRAFIRF